MEKQCMNILVTGSAGFVGRNLVDYFRAVPSENDRASLISEIYEYDRENSIEQLESWCAKADFVFNLAGVNRPKSPEEYWSGNVEFASLLLNLLKTQGNKCPVMLASSLQASLSGRFGISEYGLSKRECEELFFQYESETEAPVYVYRFPNLVGKGVRPNYNSAVGTFCYNVANDLPITISDENVVLEMLFIEDLIDEMYNALKGQPHRCEYPQVGENGYDGLTPKPADAGRFCYAPLTYKATLGYIAKCLKSFHDQPPAITLDNDKNSSFEAKLYSMYLSYLSPIGGKV